MSSFTLKGKPLGSIEEACAAVSIEVPTRRNKKWAASPQVGYTRTDTAGRVLQFADGKGGAAFNFRTGEYALFFFDISTGTRKISRAEMKRREAEAREALVQETKRIAQRQAQIAVVAQRIYSASVPSDPEPPHGYLQTKHLAQMAVIAREITSSAFRRVIEAAAVYEPEEMPTLDYMQGRVLVFPLMSAEGVTSLQFIDEDGRKIFLKGGRIKGSCWYATGLGEPQQGVKAVGVAEGIATAMSVQGMFGIPCVASMSAGNVSEVLSVVCSLYPEALINFFADRDANGVGAKAAGEAIEKLPRYLRGKILLPSFTAQEIDFFKQLHGGKSPTDFNDLKCIKESSHE